MKKTSVANSLLQGYLWFCGVYPMGLSIIVNEQEKLYTSPVLLFQSSLSFSLTGKGCRKEGKEQEDWNR